MQRLLFLETHKVPLMDEFILLGLFSHDLVILLIGKMQSNYADHNNLRSTRKHIDKIKVIVAKEFRMVTIWFYESCMV